MRRTVCHADLATANGSCGPNGPSNSNRLAVANSAAYHHSITCPNSRACRHLDAGPEPDGDCHSLTHAIAYCSPCRQQARSVRLPSA